MMMLRRSTAALARNAAPATRAFSAAANASGEAKFEFSTPFELHRLDQGPAEFAVTNRKEMLEYYELMYTLRRMAMINETEYKARKISGFCHW
ncbi:Pyruvate dehydrogenase E1 alpha subunit [Phytophthora palmivora]|uniref:Pyruvate dehydrogenase E1 alpha subunit n=1 Tax=Phytophthora palmivora TaxID=4796 RepID=A0A2P4XP97_9STRA|nr:Pyruvate dehydrogenase E1 alpha subunit [Phytophthora palmivora]